MSGECIEALYTFFSSFGLPAYEEGRVPEYGPDGAKIAPPYITVQLIAPAPGEQAPFYARVWYRDRSNTAINAKVDEIAAALAAGAAIPTAHGAVYIYAGDNFDQRQAQPGDITLKCAYLSMSVQNNTP